MIGLFKFILRNVSGIFEDNVLNKISNDIKEQMIMTEIEGWLLNKLREVEPEAQQEDIYTGKITLGGAWVMEIMEEWHIKQQKQVNNLAIPVVRLSCFKEVFEKFQETQEESEFYGWLHSMTQC